MATRSPIECPVCHEPMDRNKKLERHLFRDHRKEQLVRFVLAETAAMEAETNS